eukprot:319020_1
MQFLYQRGNSMNKLTMQILKQLNQMNKPKSFHFWKLQKESFVNKDININEMRHFKKLITDYDINLVTSRGLHVVVGDLSVPIIIKCPRNSKYNENLQWVIPYSFEDEYKISMLLKEIIDYINDKNKPMVFIINKIKSESFLETEMDHNDYNWENLNADVTNYSENDLKNKGLSLEIDVNAYTLDITALVPVCKDMKSEHELCPIYAKMRYQDIFSED